MLSKSKLQAMEKGAPTRGVYGEKYQVNYTQYKVFLPNTLTNKYMHETVTIGQVEFKLDHNAKRIHGPVPESWFIDLSEDVTETEELAA